jgi:hypothetical protein
MQSERISPAVPMNAPKVGIGPSRPTIIAHRFWCPSCNAEPGEACRLSPRFTQDYSHIARHRVAQRAAWVALMRELPISTGWTLGR